MACQGKQYLFTQLSYYIYTTSFWVNNLLPASVAHDVTTRIWRGGGGGELKCKEIIYDICLMGTYPDYHKY